MPDVDDVDDAATVIGPPQATTPNISPDYVDIPPNNDLGFQSPEDMDVETEDYRTYRTRALEEARQRYQEQMTFVSDAIHELTQEFDGTDERPSPVDERLLQALQVQHNQIVQAHEILNDTVNQIISGARPEEVFSVLPARFERARPTNASSSSTAQIEAELRGDEAEEEEEEYDELPRYEGEGNTEYRERKAMYRRQQKQRVRESSTPSNDSPVNTGGSRYLGYPLTTLPQPPATGHSISSFPAPGRGSRGVPPHPPRAGWMRRLRTNGRPIPLPPLSPMQMARQTPPHLHRPQPVRPSSATRNLTTFPAPAPSAVRFAPISTTVTHAATPSQFAGNVLVGNRATPRFIDAFVEAGLERLTTQIQRVLGSSLPNAASAPKTAAKPPLPTPYRGQNNHEIFETWANTLIRYLRLSRYCGDEWDEDRLLHLGTALDGPAADWFREEVEHAHFIEGTAWTFAEAMCALYARFVRAGTAQRMAERYDSVHYSAARGGINTLYNELLRYANRMAQPPDTYSIARRFLREMPTDVSSVLEYIYMMSAESSPIEDMLEAALHVEDVNARQSRARGGDSATPSRPLTRILGPRRTSQQTRPPSRPDGPSARGSNNVGSTPQPREQRSTADRDQNRVARRDTRRDAPPANRKPYDSKGKSTDKSHVKCFKCGGTGHYSTDQECPLYSKASVRMMTTTEAAPPTGEDAPRTTSPSRLDAMEPPIAGDEETEPIHRVDRIDEYESDGEVEGSQYDPDGERYDEDDYDWYAPDEQYEDANEEFDRLASMRVLADDIVEESDFDVSEQEAREFEDMIRAVEMPEDPDQTIRPPTPMTYDDLPELEDDPIPHPLPQPEDITHANVRNMFYDLPEEIFLGLIELRLRMGSRALRETQVETAHLQNELERVRREARNAQLEAIVLGNRAARELQRRSVAEQELAGIREQLAVANARTASPPRYLEDAPPVYESPAPATRPLTRTSTPQERQRPGDSLYNNDPQFSRARSPSSEAEDSTTDTQEGPSTRPQIPRAGTATGITITSRIPRATMNGVSRTVTIARTTGSNARANVLSRYREATDSHRLAAITQPDRGYRATVHPASSASQRPRTTGHCMVIEARIGTLTARVLLDSGSTLNCVSPDFLQASGIRPFELSSPITLQLGCVGSRSKANFGVRTKIQIGPGSHDVYLDVVNIDHYDIILGVPFMHDTRAIMNWGEYSVTLGTTIISALRGEGASLSHNTHRNHRDDTPARNALNSVRETR